MATTKKRMPKKTKEKPAMPKKLSKAGEWMRAHPIGDMIVYDKSVLYT